MSGETVLDPFLGSGTTALAARRLQRHSIGYEINESFVPVIRKKIGAEQADIFSQTVVEVVKPARAAIDYRLEIQKLPYIFHDPVRFDKKIDPRKMTFGSKIEAGSNQGVGQRPGYRENICRPEISGGDSETCCRA